jgi:hypothetical protein
LTVRISVGTELDELAVRNMLVAYLNELAAWDPGLVMNDVGLPVWEDFGLPGPRTGPEAAQHNWWIRDDCERLVIREGDSAVGFAIIASPPHHIEEPFDHEVVDYYVAPKARGRGSCSRLRATSWPKRSGAGCSPEGRPSRWRNATARASSDSAYHRPTGSTRLPRLSV